MRGEHEDVQLNDDPNAPNKPSDGNYAVLKGQVDNLSGQVAEVKAQIGRVDQTLSNQIERVDQALGSKLDRQTDNFNKKFDALAESWSKSRTPNPIGWTGAVVGLVSVVMLSMSYIGSLAKVPIDQSLERHELEIQHSATKEELKDAIANIGLRFVTDERDIRDRVTIREYDEFKKHIDDKINSDHDLIVKEVARLDTAVTGITSDFVRRPEILAFRADDLNRIEALSRNVEDVRKEVGSLFPSGDVIKNIESQLEALSTKVFQILAISQGPSNPPPSK